MRPALCLLISVLVLGMSVQLAVPGNATRSIMQVSQGQSIQRAIDSAAPNDTILVSPGVYYEHLAVYKPLHLMGWSRDTTIIDGGGMGPVILVNSSNVQISGFTIRNALTFGQGIYVKNVVHVNITLDNISAASDGDGISLDGSNNNTITDNIFSGNLYAVNATHSDYNLIARNKALGNIVGVQLWNSKNNVVADNTLRGGESGLFLYLAYQNLLVRNVAIKNSEIGVHLVNSTGNKIVENSFEFNRFGIDIQYSPGNTFYHNNIVSSSLYQVNFVSPTDKPLTTWDNETASCPSCVKAGNYWDDYRGVDTNHDGIGDTNLPADGVDYYPLIAPFAPLLLAVKFNASSVKGPAPLTITFTAHVLGGTLPYTYHWDFGDGVTASSPTTPHTYTQPGSYTVRLQISDYAGASDQDTVTITVESPAPPQLLNVPLLAAAVLGVSGAGFTAFFWRRRRRQAPKGPLSSKRHQ